MYRNSKYYKQNVNQKTKVDTKRRSENSEKNVYRLIGKESEDNNEEMDIEQIKYNFEKKKSISLLISSMSSKKKIIKKESFNEKVDIYKINEETYNRPTNIIYDKM